ncbi:ImmA/IrrE family metallo-endopeptidase [Nakamurella multipartita]|uniref:IrrE N-terminal-like domain-containing protein n=1 Tax=Nakamurella multipartita (strain ATCC 700099 / DSM 44233 / CIP 104796 / JCM 9543 / NBRC 105858 / Y-104) TaxID=479431 RepID=C8X7R3_NAKMY|nr:ImmA/IrrE family metallo-endopeptidase [Nakamurella multipartita]ACV80916.1 protein of unknown function DUF955 [Nakamurella multipartita DSM 44233]
MTRENEPETMVPSVLTSLRALTPQRPASFTEALRVAEQQAARLLGRFDIRQWPVPETILLELPRIQVEQRFDLPTSGCSFWESDRRTWVIQVNGNEPSTRQRFTLLHEYKHIVDHGRVELLYGAGQEALVRAEHAADYFAGCALIPRGLLKRAWGERLQQVAALAAAFDVSLQAINVRLAQSGLTDVAPRCALGREPASSRPVSSRRYQRPAHPDFPHLEVVAT